MPREGREHLILCGGAAARGKRHKGPPVVLDAPRPGDGNVHLRVEDITGAMTADLPGVVADLVEIATYVYCGDQRWAGAARRSSSTGRSGGDGCGSGCPCGGRTCGAMQACGRS